MQPRIFLALFLLVFAAAAAAAEEPTYGKLCSTLGKVSAHLEQQLFPVRVIEVNGRLNVRRDDACFPLAPGTYKLGIGAIGTRAGSFPGMRNRARGAQRLQVLELTVEAGHTYTLAARIIERHRAEWMPMVESDVAWAIDR